PCTWTAALKQIPVPDYENDHGSDAAQGEDNCQPIKAVVLGEPEKNPPQPIEDHVADNQHNEHGDDNGRHTWRHGYESSFRMNKKRPAQAGLIIKGLRRSDCASP